MATKTAAQLKAEWGHTDPEDQNTNLVDSVSALLSVTAGAAAANKAVVLDSNKRIDEIVVGTLKLGAGAGAAVTSTPAELNKLDGAGANVTAANLDELTGGGDTALHTHALAEGASDVTATAAEVNQAADLSANGGLIRVKKLAIGATPTGAEQDTTWDLPAKSVVLDVFVDVTTAEATGGTKTLDVGLSSGEAGGDADGFLDGINVASTGVKKGNFAATAGGNNTYVGAAATHTIGALLSFLVAGEDVAGGGDGVAARTPHVCDGVAVSVTFTAGSNDWAEFRGDIYVVYLEIG